MPKNEQIGIDLQTDGAQQVIDDIDSVNTAVNKLDAQNKKIKQVGKNISQASSRINSMASAFGQSAIPQIQAFGNALEGLSTGGLVAAATAFGAVTMAVHEGIKAYQSWLDLEKMAIDTTLEGLKDSVEFAKKQNAERKELVNEVLQYADKENLTTLEFKKQEIAVERLKKAYGDLNIVRDAKGRIINKEALKLAPELDQITKEEERIKTLINKSREIKNSLSKSFETTSDEIKARVELNKFNPFYAFMSNESKYKYSKAEIEREKQFIETWSPWNTDKKDREQVNKLNDDIITYSNQLLDLHKKKKVINDDIAKGLLEAEKKAAAEREQMEAEAEKVRLAVEQKKQEDAELRRQTLRDELFFKSDILEMEIEAAQIRNAGDTEKASEIEREIALRERAAELAKEELLTDEERIKMLDQYNRLLDAQGKPSASAKVSSAEKYVQGSQKDSLEAWKSIQRNIMGNNAESSDIPARQLTEAQKQTKSLTEIAGYFKTAGTNGISLTEVTI